MITNTKKKKKEKELKHQSLFKLGSNKNFFSGDKEPNQDAFEQLLWELHKVDAPYKGINEIKRDNEMLYGKNSHKIDEPNKGKISHKINEPYKGFNQIIRDNEILYGKDFTKKK